MATRALSDSAERVINNKIVNKTEVLGLYYTKDELKEDAKSLQLIENKSGKEFKASNGYCKGFMERWNKSAQKTGITKKLNATNDRIGKVEATLSNFYGNIIVHDPPRMGTIFLDQYGGQFGMRLETVIANAGQGKSVGVIKSWDARRRFTFKCAHSGLSKFDLLGLFVQTPNGTWTATTEKIIKDSEISKYFLVIEPTKSGLEVCLTVYIYISAVLI